MSTDHPLALDPDLAGRRADPGEEEVDARWLMAFAAALGETAAEYLDTRRPGGPRAHPVFPVCYEWPATSALRAAAIPPEVALRAVHATHDLHIHRLPRAGDRLRTSATIRAVEPRAPGAYVVTRLVTLDAAGAPVTTTDHGSIYRGVACAAAGRLDPAPHLQARPGAGGSAWSTDLPVPATLAHVYSECSRIWNPIHTDRAVAEQAGLPDIILHGTAVLGLAVSEVLHRAGGDAGARVARIIGRFGGMVRIPSTVTVRGTGACDTPDGPAFAFDVLTEDGRAALRDGWLVLASSR